MSQFTKQAIIASFMKLLEQKPLDKISVKDIVLDCGVNRGTFYYYYDDIFALIDDIFEIEISRVISLAGDNPSWQEGFIQSIKFALENKKIIFHAFNSVNRQQLTNYLYKTTYKYIIDYIETQSKDLYVAEDDKLFIAEFYQTALVSLAFDWIGKGMRDDPMEKIKKLEKLFDGSVREALIKSDKRNIGK